MHLADAFVQSDLQLIQAIHFSFISMCVPWELNLGIQYLNFALLTQCSTTEPQEHDMLLYATSLVVFQKCHFYSSIYIAKHNVAMFFMALYCFHNKSMSSCFFAMLHCKKCIAL